MLFRSAKLVKRLEKQRRLHAGDPLASLRAGLHEYIDFGLRHPSHYIVTFMQREKAHDAAPPFEESPGREAFELLVQCVSDCVSAGLFREVRIDLVSQTLWMSIHGLVSLLVTEKPFPFAPAAALANEQIETLLRGLARSPA